MPGTVSSNFGSAIHMRIMSNYLIPISRATASCYPCVVPYSLISSNRRQHKCQAASTMYNVEYGPHLQRKGSEKLSLDLPKSSSGELIDWTTLRSNPSPKSLLRCSSSNVMIRRYLHLIARSVWSPRIRRILMHSTCVTQTRIVYPILTSS